MNSLAKLLGPVLVALLAGACAAEAQVEPSELDQAAEALRQLHNGDEHVESWFPTHSPALNDRMAWFRGVLGTCDRFEVYRMHGPKRARFVYHCERGELEALIGIGEDGRVDRLLTGARGVDPPPQVRAAAERWLESPAGEADASGCRIDRVHLGSQTGALFVLACDAGERTLVFDLDHQGELRRHSVVDHAADEWRVPASVG